MLDPLLAAFVQAADDVGASRELEVLLEHHVTPLVRAVAARKLREDPPRHPAVADLDDVVSEVTLVLIERMSRLRHGGDERAAPIENLPNYAVTVAHNVCAHAIRRRYPARARLKNRMRYVLEQDSRAAIWTAADGQLVCGLAAWRPREVDRSASESMRRLAESADHRLILRDGPSTGKQSVANLVHDALRAVRGPVAFDELIGAVARANGIDVAPAPMNSDTLVAAGRSGEVTIDLRRSAARLWNEIVVLPVRQRVALLLNLRDVGGDGVLWTLPVAGIATLREIAAVLELPPLELAAMWKALPLDDQTIAARLGCTRQQVINLRMAARRRLANRLRPASGESQARDNLRVVSTSLGRDT